MFRNLIPNFTFKAVSAGDQMYVDDEGKHIIFRNIHGKVVPIHTDAEGYAEWLQKQGVPLDPADQKTLRSLEKELDVLSRAAEVGGPALQKQYEKAFEKQRQQYTGMVQQYYQQALQKQAQEQKTTPEKIHKQGKALYEQHKGEVQKRGALPDKGWGSYIESYVNQLIKSAGAKPDEMLWYTLKAFDLALVKAMEMAKEGVTPAQINLDDLVREELESGSGMREHYESRYKPYASEAKNEYSILANLYPGLENLEDNLKSNSPGASALRDHFNQIYRRMYDDFNPEEKAKFTRIEPNVFEGSPETLPRELPEHFTPAEAGALMNVFDNFRGAKLNATHRVFLHAAARIFDGISDGDKVGATVELTDPKTGLHALHRLEYRLAYERYYHYNQDVDMAREVEEVLRTATRAAESGSTREKIQALKEIAQRLGRIDGTILLRKSDKKPSMDSYMKKWANASLNAGLAKGDGPDLINTLTDEEARNAATYTNQALRIPHQGAPAQPTKKADEFDELPQIEEEEEVSPEERASSIYPGFHVSSGKIISDDGFVITPEGNRWRIKSPTGANAGSIQLQPQEGDEAAREQYKNYVFGVAKQLIDNYKKREPQIPENVQQALDEEAVIPAFQFNAPLSPNEQQAVTDLTKTIAQHGIEVSTKMPGKVFRLSRGDSSVDFLYNPKKKALMVGHRDARGNLTFDTDVSPESVLSKLGVTNEPKVPENKPEVSESDTRNTPVASEAKEESIQEGPDLSHLSEEDKQKYKDLKDTYAKDEAYYKKAIKQARALYKQPGHQQAGRNRTMSLGFAWSKRKKELQSQMDALVNPPQPKEEEKPSLFNVKPGSQFMSKPTPSKEHENVKLPTKEAAKEQPEQERPQEKEAPKKEKVTLPKVGEQRTIERQSGFGNTQRVTIEALPDGQAKVVSWERKKKGEGAFKPVTDEVGKISPITQFFPNAEETQPNEKEAPVEAKAPPQNEEKPTIGEAMETTSVDENKKPSNDVVGDADYFRGPFSREELEDLLSKEDPSKVYWTKQGNNYKVYLPNEMYNKWSSTQDYYKEQTKKSTRNFIQSLKF